MWQQKQVPDKLIYFFSYDGNKVGDISMRKMSADAACPQGYPRLLKALVTTKHEDMANPPTDGYFSHESGKKGGGVGMGAMI